MTTDVFTEKRLQERKRWETYRLRPFSQPPGMRWVRHRQKSLPASKCGTPSTWEARLSRTPQFPDCQSWSWWRRGHSGCPGRGRPCSRQCLRFAWPPAAASRPPWWRSTTRHRPWRGREVHRGLRGWFCAIKSRWFVQPVSVSGFATARGTRTWKKKKINEYLIK